MQVCKADNLSFYQSKIITINNAGAGFCYPVPALLIPQGEYILLLKSLRCT